jgi:ERCC4-type nuclease
MKIILDNREHLLYDKIQSALFATPMQHIQITFEPIPLGDIIIQSDEDKPIVIIERKSLSDLLSSIKDGRYEEQSYRLSHSNECCPHNIIYLIEGMFSILRNPQEKKIALSDILSLNHFKGFSVLRTNNMQETADIIIAFADKLSREYAKGKNGFYMTTRPPPLLDGISPDGYPPDEKKEEEITYSNVVKKVKKENLTPENMGEIILSQIPGISSITAKAIILKFGSLVKMIDVLKSSDSKQEFENITYMTNGKSRRIGKTTYENICKFLLV